MSGSRRNPERCWYVRNWFARFEPACRPRQRDPETKQPRRSPLPYLMLPVAGGPRVDRQQWRRERLAIRRLGRAMFKGAGRLGRLGGLILDAMYLDLLCAAANRSALRGVFCDPAGRRAYAAAEIGDLIGEHDEQLVERVLEALADDTVGVFAVGTVDEAIEAVSGAVGDDLARGADTPAGGDPAAVGDSLGDCGAAGGCGPGGPPDASRQCADACAHGNTDTDPASRGDGNPAAPGDTTTPVALATGNDLAARILSDTDADADPATAGEGDAGADTNEHARADTDEDAGADVDENPAEVPAGEGAGDGTATPTAAPRQRVPASDPRVPDSGTDTAGRPVGGAGPTRQPAGGERTRVPVSDPRVPGDGAGAPGRPVSTGERFAIARGASEAVFTAIEAYSDPELYAQIVYVRLGWPAATSTRRAHRERGAYAAKCRHAHEAGLDPAALADFLGRRLRKASYLGRSTYPFGDRARMWMADFTRQLAVAIAGNGGA